MKLFLLLQTNKRFLLITLLATFTLSVIVSHRLFIDAPQKALASILGTGGTACGVQFSATDALAGGVYTLVTTMRNTTGGPISVVYEPLLCHCLSGQGEPAGLCNTSCQSGGVATKAIPAGASVVVPASVVQTNGLACGSFQIDFGVRSINGQTNCNASNVFGVRTTGVTCTIIPTPSQRQPIYQCNGIACEQCRDTNPNSPDNCDYNGATFIESDCLNQCAQPTPTEVSCPTPNPVTGVAIDCPFCEQVVPTP